MSDVLNTRSQSDDLSTFETALVLIGDHSVGQAMLAQSVARMRVCAGDTAERILRESYPEVWLMCATPHERTQLIDDLTAPD